MCTCVELQHSKLCSTHSGLLTKHTKGILYLCILQYHCCRLSTVAKLLLLSWIYSRDVHVHVCTYVSVTLRNVNMRYRLGMSIEVALGMSICAHDVRYVHYMTTSGQRLLATEDGEDSTAGPSQHTHLWNQVHKRVLNSAGSWRF